MHCGEYKLMKSLLFGLFILFSCAFTVIYVFWLIFCWLHDNIEGYLREKNTRMGNKGKGK